MERTFPRVRQKSIIKKYQKKARLSRNADILIFLDYILFLKRLAAEASIKALEEGERTLKSNHVNTVFKVRPEDPPGTEANGTITTCLSVENQSLIKIFLDYILFLKRLAAEASIKALEEGERTIFYYKPECS